jgi:hypothetical protein
MRRIQTEDAAHLVEQVNSGELTVEEAASRASDSDMEEYPVSVRTFKRFCKRRGIELKPKRGRPVKGINPELRKHVEQLFEERRVGRCLMTQILLEEGIDVTEWEVHKIYQASNLYTHSIDTEKQPHTSQYEALQKNLIWHTDLHDLVVDYEEGQSKHIIAFMDDGSRKIVGWKLLQDKNSKTVTKVLEKILQTPKQQKPYTIWTDNGKEFLGEFKTYLRKKRINHNFTQPYSPQQNGKIERFWQKVDKFGDDSSTFPAQMDLYNNTPHFGLPKPKDSDHTGSRYYTPNGAYERLPNWNRNLKNWRVDKEIRKFK